MAQMVKAVRMILGMDSYSSKQPLKNAFDIEIEDDAPKRKPTLEEIDALEVHLFNLSRYYIFNLHSNLLHTTLTISLDFTLDAIPMQLRNTSRFKHVKPLENTQSNTNRMIVETQYLLSFWDAK